ncbi:MAG: hypothetical protein HN417_11965 [Desulfobacula sp.]|nr:hypothetical protein [Desulfobacula sp.]
MKIFRKEKIGNPELFTGRKKELSKLLHWAEMTRQEMSQSMALLSRRKTGKTAILERLYNILFYKNDKIVPFYFEIKESKQYLLDFARDYFLTFIYQYIAFKTRKTEYLSILTPPSFEHITDIAKKENLIYLPDLIQSVHELTKKEQAERMWDTVREAPRRIAFHTNERIVQIIDEFQFLNSNIYRDNKITQKIDDMAASYFHTIEHRNAPFLLSGSWVGWLMDDIRTMLPARVRVQSLNPLPEPESHEMTLKYALLTNTPVKEETAWLIARVCEGNPFYITCLFTSDFEEKDLTKEKGVLSALNYEIVKGFIKGAWMEYFHAAIKDINNKNAKNIVIYLSKNRERDVSIKEIQTKLHLEVTEIELEKRMKALLKSDIIEQGRSNFYYRGLQDNIFDKVFRGVYADDIADFDHRELYDEYKELFIKLNKEYNKIKGEYNFFKGQFAEFIILNHLKYRAWKENNSFCKMMENLPKDFKFVEYETVWSYNAAVPHKKDIKIDILAVTSSGYSLIGEIKNRKNTLFSKDETEQFLKKAETAIELENIEKVVLFVFSSNGFTQDALSFMKERGIAWSADARWLDSSTDKIING